MTISMYAQQFRQQELQCYQSMCVRNSLPSYWRQNTNNSSCNWKLFCLGASWSQQNVTILFISTPEVSEVYDILVLYKSDYYYYYFYKYPYLTYLLTSLACLLPKFSGDKSMIWINCFQSTIYHSFTIHQLICCIVLVIKLCYKYTGLSSLLSQQLQLYYIAVSLLKHPCYKTSCITVMDSHKESVFHFI